MEFNFFLVYIFIVVILFFLIFIKFFVLSKKKSKIILAEIDKIEVLFLRDNKFWDCQLGIYYKFIVRKREYKSFCKIPFSELLEFQNNIEILHNKEFELPILKINQEYYIGNEAIEHKILQILTHLPIRYLISDPKRNFPLPLSKKYFISKK